ncbi:MAG TPA: MarR family transcriptional regulator [Verrucomicrobiae bacterium]|nr:MarR family transcriptional regulator [Verrucomicrobiae bacterium]
MEDTSPITMSQACLLHSRADRALRVVVSRQLEQFDVTMMEWLLMSVVCNGPKEGMTMSAVASALDVTLPQVTALTASLTKSKLVKQKVSRQDRRSRRLICAPSGKRLVEETESAINKAMKDWTADIPPEQLKIYLATVELLAMRKVADAAD